MEPQSTRDATTVQDEIVRRAQEMTTQDIIEIHKIEMAFITEKYIKDSNMFQKSIQAQKELMVSLAELGYEIDVQLPGLPPAQDPVPVLPTPEVSDVPEVSDDT